MFLAIADAVERHLYTTIFTAVSLVICVGLSWWIWLDRLNRVVPDRADLIEIQGLASSPQFRNRSSSVWFRFQPSAGQLAGVPAPSELRVSATDVASIETAMADGPVLVTVWVVRAELGRGVRDEPPSVLQLSVGDRTLVPLAAGQQFRAERAANARLSAWIAGAGAAVALLALFVHWGGKLLR
jgi:hypothetical protein